MAITSGARPHLARRSDATGGAARGRIEIPAAGLFVVIVALGMIYGACMGVYALMRNGDESYLQLLASTVKVPALFVLTLVVTFPSLYVFNALVGSRLRVAAVLRLLLAALGVNLAILASMGPIVAFFVSTTSYSFMVLLNVVIFAVAGFLGLLFLLQTLHRLSLVEPLSTPIGESPPPEEPMPPAAPSPEAGAPMDAPLAVEPESPLREFGPLERLKGHVLGTHVKAVFRCWVVVFGLVGAQMAWVLRPFIGNPDLRFAWFRERESNFFEAVWNTLRNLFS